MLAKCPRYKAPIYCMHQCFMWQNLSNWIFNKVGVNIAIDNVTKILGYVQLDQHFWPLNFVFLVLKNKFSFGYILFAKTG